MDGGARTNSVIGSDPSFNEVKTMLDARSGLKESYHDMEDEIDDFINFDTEFINCPRFYTKLISLARTTSESMDEALSMSLEYLSNVSDVGDVFQDSLMTCLELSSQIANLNDTTRKPSQSETRKLVSMKTRLAGTLTRMEDHWDNLSQEIRTQEDTVMFSELDSLVQMARFTTENLPPFRETNRTPKEFPIPVTQNESGDNVESAPEDVGDESAVSHTQEVVKPTNPGKRDIAKGINTTPGNPCLNGGVVDRVKLDEDERDGLRRIAETFESVRSDMATAWNKAMIWIDNELVFTRLNTLMTVAKEATDRVIEATLRAKANAIKQLQNTNGPTVTCPQYKKGKHVTPTELVQQPAAYPHYQSRPPKPLTTESDRLIPVRRVHERGEDPQLIVQEVVEVKKLEIQLPGIANPRHPESSSRGCKCKIPVL